MGNNANGVPRDACSSQRRCRGSRGGQQRCRDSRGGSDTPKPPRRYCGIHVDHALPIIDAIVEENERLKKFAKEMFTRAFEGMDIEGDQVQEIAYGLGLLELRKVDPSENEWEADELYFPTWEKP